MSVSKIIFTGGFDWAKEGSGEVKRTRARRLNRVRCMREEGLMRNDDVESWRCQGRDGVHINWKSNG
jgi:hypothetical protein